MERTEKVEHILEAAVRRFAHFGVQKTTLTEIADDLGMTKQALAYYFPDKHSLSAAVESQIIAEFVGLVEQRFSGAAGLEQALMGFVEVKITFFEKYAMLMQTAAADKVYSHSRVAESKIKVERHMVQLIAGLLEQGMATGELKQMNVAEVSVLIVETLSAFEQCTVTRQVIPDPQTFSELCNKQKAVIRLMVNGLKKEAWKH